MYGLLPSDRKAVTCSAAADNQSARANLVEYVFVACLLSGACLRQNETVLCWSVCGYGRISSREFAHPHKEARQRAHADCTTTISQGQYYLVDRVGSGSNRGDSSRNFDPAGWSCFPKKRNTAIMLCVLPN